MRRLIECLGEERPTLVAYEDIHWAASSELDLLEYLGTQLRETAAVLIVLARPELSTSGRGAPACRPFQRGARPVERGRDARDDRGPRRRRARLGPDDRATRGDVGRATRSSSRSCPPPSPTGPRRRPPGHGHRRHRIPPRHPPAASPRGAVLGIGRRSQLLARRRRGGVRGEAVDDALDELERRDLVRREHSSRLEGDVEYRFRHALIRDVAYATIPRAERAGRHADVARYIEASVGEDTGPVAWILAHHWRAAGDPARAVPHLLAAAEIAERGWATHEVVDLYSRALELAADDGMRATIRLRRAWPSRRSTRTRTRPPSLRRCFPSCRASERLDCTPLPRHGRDLVRAATRRRSATASWRLAFAEELGEATPVALPRAALVSNALAMRGDVGDVDRAIELGDEALVLLASGSTRLRARRPPSPPGGREVLGRRLPRLRRQLARARGRRGGEVQSVARTAPRRRDRRDGERRARRARGRPRKARGDHVDRPRARRSRRVPAELPVGDLPRGLRPRRVAAANEIALEAARDLTFGMPKRFALSDLLRRTSSPATSAARRRTGRPCGRTQARRRGGPLADPRAPRGRPGRDRAPRRAARGGGRVGTKAVEITVRTRRRKYEALARTHLGARSWPCEVSRTVSPSSVPRRRSRTSSSTRGALGPARGARRRPARDGRRGRGGRGHDGGHARSSPPSQPHSRLRAPRPCSVRLRSGSCSPLG